MVDIRINGAMLCTTQLQTYLEKPFQEDLREQKLFAHFLEQKEEKKVLSGPMANP